MKKHNLFFAALTATVLFVACDPGYYEEVVIHNLSTHTVTVIPTPSDEFYVHDSCTLAPDDKDTVADPGGLGSASRSGCEYYMELYMGDSVVFVFDDDRRIVYYKENRDGISPYNFNSANYSYEERLNERGPFKGYAGYGKLTFAVTDEHYEAATTVTE